MFKYDTVHGRFNGTVEGKPDGLYINGKKIHVFTSMKVRALQWGILSKDSAWDSSPSHGARLTLQRAACLKKAWASLAWLAPHVP